jgi:hypothetical protein
VIHDQNQSQTPEASMRKLPHLAVGLAFTILTATFLTRSLMLTAAVPLQPQTISIEELHRSIDLTALPVHHVTEPF